MTTRKNVSVAKQARQAQVQDTKSRKTLITGQDEAVARSTIDSFVNFQQKLGIGADNALSSASYGFNPITRNRIQLEWIHRGSWLGGVAVDVVANDMTRGGVELKGKIAPAGMEKINEAARTLKIWERVNECVRWDRLYGGSIAVLLVEGQSLKTPLRLETLAKGQFRGLYVLDRWMVNPTLNDIVTDFGPDLGLPKFYDVLTDTPALRGERIHHSRVMRLDGVKLPYWQRLVENMWGTSVIERLYDRMVAFDSATTGAAQLVYKAYIRTYKIKGLRDLIAAGGPAMAAVATYVDFMRKFQGQEGITLMDTEDEFEGTTSASAGFTGISDALVQFSQQLAGALQIPLVRLFGMSPSGFSTGDTDLQMYYDTILQQQNERLLDPVTRIYRAIAASEGVKLPDGFAIQFNNLWQLDEKEKADVVTAITGAVVQANESGLISDQVAMKELRQTSNVTGVFSNITDKDINQADDVAAPPEADEVLGGEGNLDGDADKPETLTKEKSKEKAEEKKPKEKEDDIPKKEVKKGKTKDYMRVTAELHRLHDLQIAIENPRGTLRNGGDWIVAQPADYGYFLGTVGHDGDGVDCYVGTKHASTDVWVMDQLDPVTGTFDEHKVFVGYGSLADCLADYTTAFTDGRVFDRIGSMTKLSIDQFKGWIANYRRQPL